ncbi:hypothetical protein DL767_008312 [Monosporascus sp. MG133]|nr:hypothetical protein DL767_008312 [Monosporascus sp. MG133]
MVIPATEYSQHLGDQSSGGLAAVNSVAEGDEDGLSRVEDEDARSDWEARTKGIRTRFSNPYPSRATRKKTLGDRGGPHGKAQATR